MFKRNQGHLFRLSFKGNLARCSKETRDINFDSSFKVNLALCSKETRDIYFDSSFKVNLALFKGNQGHLFRLQF